MSPEVTAALIAGSVGIVTVIATVIVQIVGFRSTKANTEQQIKATHKDTADTLDQQSEHLDKTLAEQREQLDRTLAEQRTRTLNERFATAADKLGGDRPPAVRLAGVYAMAGLADDWPENRQTCVDVLCAYLRLPYEPDPGEDAPKEKRLDFHGSREVRHTVIRVIAAHLRLDAAMSWQGLDFDFTGTVFDGGDFSFAEFSSSKVSFYGAKFSGGTVDFSYAEFPDDQANFSRAEFSGGTVDFSFAKFSGGQVGFLETRFSGGTVNFRGAEFSDGEVDFDEAVFSDGEVDFRGAVFSGGEVDFRGAEFSGGTVRFLDARFSGGQVDFDEAEFSGGTVSFYRAVFSGGKVDFRGAVFSGSEVRFLAAQFSSGTVDFSQVDDWSAPPAFPWTDSPPSGVKLPRKEDQSRT
jgi:uncharacterized protein YjbI with pentapeptide repeats/uncharacterized membrane-anchored protein YhcB (DUF1043 family)